MNVLITENGKETVRLSLPSGMIFNRLTASFISSSLKSYGVTVTKRQTAALLKELNRFRRQHPGWVLCEVERPNGGCVKITL